MNRVVLVEYGGSPNLRRNDVASQLEHAVAPSDCIESTVDVVEVDHELNHWSRLAGLNSKHGKSQSLLKQTNKALSCK